MIPNPNLKFVFTGDSITNYWDIQTDLNIPASSFINTGIPGNTTAQLLKRFGRDVLDFHPEHVILLIGVNDIWPLEHSPYYHGKILSVEKIKSKLISNYEKIINACLLANQSLIICSILPTNLSFSSKNEERNQLIVEINEILKTWCKQYNFIYVDFHQALVSKDKRSIRSGLTVDGLHLNSTGYQIFSSILQESFANKDICI